MRHKLTRAEVRRFRARLIDRRIRETARIIMYGPRELRRKPKPLLAIASLFPHANVAAR